MSAQNTALSATRSRDILARTEAGEIPAEFPFESNYVAVHGSKMHYIDVGQGDPILFIHGNPASCYLWRNIIPHVQDRARCIALDLIGMGRSDKPDLEYTYADHARYLAGFVEALGLAGERNLTLVIHDWGSMLGFDWASQHAGSVRAVAFMEAMVQPLSFAELPAGVKPVMRLMRTRFFNWLMGGVANVFLTKMLPELTHREMSPEVRAAYQAPFPTIESRRAVRRFPMEVPFDGLPAQNHQRVVRYIDWIARTDVPMLMLHGDDGVAIKADEIAWLHRNVTELEVVDLGPGKHFLQETHPHRIGREIAQWFDGLPPIER